MPCRAATWKRAKAVAIEAACRRRKRRPGIRGRLRENCPLLAARYQTAMGAKALAEKAQASV